MLDIAKLVQFTVLARSGSYTAAAAALHVSQPTLTRNIQSLEHSLRARLLDRGRNGIALTAIGEELLQHAEDLLRHAASIEADIAARSQGIRGHVRVGVGPSIGGAILPGVVMQVAESGLDISIRIELAPATTMYDMLLAGELDFVISREPNRSWSEKLSTTIIGHATPEFFVRHSHPLAQQREVTIEELGRYPLICGTAWNEVLPSMVPPEALRHLQATIEVDDTGLSYHIAQGLDGVLVSGRGLVQDNFVQLTLVDRGGHLEGAPVTLNRPSHRTLSPAVEYVMKLAVEAARSVYAPGIANADSGTDDGVDREL
ncbi:LysR family transcriptional regulator [Dactylosporangium sp. NPDC048998]|uniref:LysR substrate-binding domain-containing protein n=1 Tax=Dactylosporangium sp. NPDC048998 TaxID=3363976 RepID=UPI0037170E41